MNKLSNICILDARNVTEETLNNITEINNVNCLIVSDETDKLLGKIKKSNIVSTIRCNKDCKIISRNGEVTIDKGLLEETDSQLILSVNGVCCVEDMPKQLINDKIYKMVVNGELVCGEKLKSVIDLKLTLNGELVVLKEGYSYIRDTVKLNESFIKKQNLHSKLTVDRLIVTSKIDEHINKYITNIAVINDIVATEQNIDILKDIVDDFHKVDLLIIPDDSIYKEDITLDPSNIKLYKNKSIVSKEKITIRDLTAKELKDNIKALHSDVVYCDDELFNTVNELSINDDMTILSNNHVSNTSKLVIDNKFLEELEHQIHINNKGKLIFDNVDPELVKSKIKSIKNFGLIIADSAVLASTKISNKGKLTTNSNDNKEKDDDYSYRNMVFLEL